MKKNIPGLLITAFVLLVTLQGCGTLRIWTISASNSHATNKPEHRTIGNLRNNSTLNLDSGVYRGDLVIRENRVTLSGEGSSRTVIAGNLHVTGNNFTLRNIRIQGDVNLSGNNGDLRGAVIEGRVNSSGHNNQW